MTRFVKLFRGCKAWYVDHYNAGRSITRLRVKEAIEGYQAKQ